MVDIKASSDLADNLELPWAPFLYTVSTLHCMTVSLGLDGDGLEGVPAGTPTCAGSGYESALTGSRHPLAWPSDSRIL
jgi:hypothetical protein